MIHYTFTTLFKKTYLKKRILKITFTTSILEWEILFYLMIWCEQSTENLSGRYLVDICVVYFDDSRCLAFVVCDSSPYGVIVAPHDGIKVVSWSFFQVQQKLEN